MNLSVTRTTRTANSTTGEFYVNGNLFSHCLEPTDRGLTSDMSLDQIAAIKVQNKTCVPTGTYNVTSYFSNKNGRNVPLVNNVPGFAYIEIHQGNFPKDTDGCLLLGVNVDVDYVGPSDAIVNQFYDAFFDAVNNGENVVITYE